MENSTFTAPAEKHWQEHWLPKAWLAALHKRLGLIYGQRFTSTFQRQETIDDWHEVWAEGLAGITAEQMRYGLSILRKTNAEWPPTMHEYRDCCKAMGDPATPLLEKKRQRSKYADDCLQKMKELLAAKVAVIRQQEEELAK